MRAHSNQRGIRQELRNAFLLFCGVQFFILLGLTIYSYHYSEDISLARIVENNNGAITEYATFADLPKTWQDQLRDLGPGTWELSVDDITELAGTELHVHIRSDGEVPRYRALSFEEENESYNLFHTYGLFALLSAAVMGLFALWASVYVARRISTPLEKLAMRLADHSPGDARPDFASLASTREIGLVADHLDRSFDQANEWLERERLFARNVSHELRTPLTVVRSAIDNASDGTVTQRQSSLNNARRALDEMDLLTAACLGLAREPDNDQTRSRIVTGVLVKSIVTSNLHLLDGKNISLDVRIDPGSGSVPADEALANLAIGNLVRNAFIHCPEGDIVIDVGARSIKVTNAAPDTEPTIFDRIAQPFSIAPTTDGHGLGLSVLGQSCQRLGWSTQSTSAAGSISIELIFAQT